MKIYLVAGSQLVPVLKLKGAIGAVLLASGQVKHVGRAGGALHVVEVPLAKQADCHAFGCATNAVGCVHLERDWYKMIPPNDIQISQLTPSKSHLDRLEENFANGSCTP